MKLFQPLLPLLHGQQAPHGILQQRLLALLGLLGRGYGWYMQQRRQNYTQGQSAAYTPPCPVISVGNLTTGGTGKTPLIRWLAQWLQAQGVKCVIVSRGYGQQSTEPVTVVSDPHQVLTTPPLAADEPYLLARALPGIPVMTGAKRQQVIEQALSHQWCDCILLDDAFQHLKVKRDLDVVLMDAQHPLGNGQLLPGGVLREPPAALKQAHVIIITRADNPQQAQAAEQTIRPFLSPDTPVLRANHVPSQWHDLHGQEIPPPKGPVMAFTGIGRPESFWHTLHHLDIPMAGQHPFPDHHPFNAQTLSPLSRQAKQQGATALVCTEKDAVKLQPQWSELPIYWLGIQWQFLSASTPLTNHLQRILTP
ncbi:tetraacyldisaccharide 4'-kinase [Magnetococcus sp. PR-3]|uniref:tetraacyldisaccharide 4'-kinase n=1 Tax=Magnetococcus sp. PR-3 TaxID=3120355 RepID=UPI002FCE4983